MRTRTKTKPRAQRELLPTDSEAAKYLRTKQPRPVAAARRRTAIAPAPAEPERTGPELVLALERADEFPHLVEEYDPGNSESRHTWRFDVRLDMGDGRRLYRCWSVEVADREKALAGLVARAGAVRVITVYGIRPPPTLDEIDDLAAANKRIHSVRDRCGPVRSADDLARQVAQLVF